MHVGRDGQRDWRVGVEGVWVSDSVCHSASCMCR
jgi:hypothetical protein